MGGIRIYDAAAIAAAELRFREDLWRTAPRDAMEEAIVRCQRFGPLLATVFGDLPDERLLNVVQGAAEPGAVEHGHLAGAIEWLRTWEVDYCVSVAEDRPETHSAEDWLSSRGYLRGGTVSRYLHTGPTECDLDTGPVEVRELDPSSPKG